jgi:hypothetical protein
VPSPSDSYAEFRDLLSALGVDPVGIGALAALRYRSEPRATTDADFLVRSLDGVAEAATARGFSVRVIADEDGEPYVVFIRGDGVAVDVLRAETDYQRTAIDRAADGWLTVEDVIVHKLIAWRDKDRDDIASILLTDPTLDDAYIERWAAEWDVADRWTAAQVSAGRR